MTQPKKALIRVYWDGGSRPEDIPVQYNPAEYTFDKQAQIAEIQIPGLAALRNGVTYEKDGVTPHWRGIFDDDGRLMVAINFNMDMGDAWELADRPFYPQMLTALAYWFGCNYVLYAMTH